MSESNASTTGTVRCVVLGRNCQAVDLSYPLNDQTIHWPGGEGFQLCMDRFHSPEYGYDCAVGKVSCGEHSGTHVDAPFHFSLEGATVDRIPLTQLIGNCKVIDVSDQCRSDADYSVQCADLEAFEAMHGPLDQGDMVLFRTGWSARYPLGALAYLGFDELTQGPYTDTTRLQFPALGESAARLLVNRRVSAVGLDTISLDPGYVKSYIVHQVLLGNGIFGIENVSGNIDLLPPVGATLMVMPLKLTGGSGSPARVVAFLP